MANLNPDLLAQQFWSLVPTQEVLQDHNLEQGAKHRVSSIYVSPCTLMYIPAIDALSFSSFSQGLSMREPETYTTLELPKRDVPEQPCSSPTEIYG